ncbi:MAG TPA: cation diffusion facilitator family transporter [Steroidobacteraceae bacterium]|nr:cation diffusion facilitator family transporter [Steroidobacteraceae bacterium]
MTPHSHAPHDHPHDHEPLRDERRLAWTLALTVGFMAVEVVGGWLAGSLALIADAGHMLTDAASISLAWFALRLARLPSDRRRSYGYQRLTVLAAFVNGIVLIGAVIWIAVEAFGRLAAPETVNGRLMLAIAVGGALVNLIGMFVLRGHGHDNLTMRSAYLHVLSDLLGSVAAVVAAIVILATGWVRIDPLLSLLVAVLIVRSAVALVRESGHILMEGAPEGFDVEKLRTELRSCVTGLIDIHHVHAWSLTSRETLLTLHARIDERADAAQALAAIKVCLAQHFGIEHSTVQIEAERCADGTDPCA